MAFPLPAFSLEEMQQLAAATNKHVTDCKSSPLQEVHDGVEEYLKASRAVSDAFKTAAETRRTARIVKGTTSIGSFSNANDPWDCTFLQDGGAEPPYGTDDTIIDPSRYFYHHEEYQRLLDDRWATASAAEANAAWEQQMELKHRELCDEAKRTLMAIVLGPLQRQDTVDATTYTGYFGYSEESKCFCFMSCEDDEEGDAMRMSDLVMPVSPFTVVCNGFVFQLWSSVEAAGVVSEENTSKSGRHLGRLFSRAFAAAVQQPTTGPPVHSPFSTTVSILGFLFTATTPTPLHRVEDAFVGGTATQRALEKESIFIREAADYLYATPAVPNTMAAPETVVKVGSDGRCYALNTVCSHADKMPGKTTPPEVLKGIRGVAAKADAAYNDRNNAFDTHKLMKAGKIPMRYGGQVFSECKTERGRNLVLLHLAVRALREIWTVQNASCSTLLRMNVDEDGSEEPEEHSNSDDDHDPNDPMREVGRSNKAAKTTATTRKSAYVALANRLLHTATHDDTFWLHCVLPVVQKKFNTPKSAKLSPASINKANAVAKFIRCAGLITSVDGVVVAVAPVVKSPPPLSSLIAPIIIPSNRESQLKHLRPSNADSHRTLCRLTHWFNYSLRAGSLKEEDFQSLWKWLLAAKDGGEANERRGGAVLGGPEGGSSEVKKLLKQQRNPLDLVLITRLLHYFVVKAARSPQTSMYSSNDAILCLCGATARILNATVKTAATAVLVRPQAFFHPFLHPQTAIGTLPHLFQLAGRLGGTSTGPFMTEIGERYAEVASLLCASDPERDYSTAIARHYHYDALAFSNQFQKALMLHEEECHKLKQLYQESGHVVPTMRSFDLRMLLVCCGFFRTAANARGTHRTFVKAMVGMGGARDLAQWLVPLMADWAAKDPPRVLDAVCLYQDIAKTLLHARHHGEALQYIKAGIGFAEAYKGPTRELKRLLGVVESRMATDAELLIQRAFRKFLSRKRDYASRLPRAFMLQRIGRAMISRVKSHEQWSLCTLQRVLRGYASRVSSMRLVQLTTLQRIGRGRLARSLGMKEWYVQRVQRVARGFKQRHVCGVEMRQRHDAAIFIQRITNAFVVRRQCTVKWNLETDASSLLANVVCGWHGRRTVRRYMCTLRLQRILAGYQARRWMGLLNAVAWRSATLLQKVGKAFCVRRNLCHDQLHKKLHATSIAAALLNRVGRGALMRVMLYDRIEVFHRQKATWMLHRCCRGLHVRLWMVSSGLHKTYWAIRRLERVGRGYLRGRRLLAKLLYDRDHAIQEHHAQVIQRVGRMYIYGRQRMVALGRDQENLPSLKLLQRVGKASMMRARMGRRFLVVHERHAAAVLTQRMVRAVMSIKYTFPVKVASNAQRCIAFMQRCGRGYLERLATNRLKYHNPRKQLLKAVREATLFHINRVADVVHLRKGKARRLAEAKEHALQVLEEGSYGEKPFARSGAVGRISPLFPRFAPAKTESVSVQTTPRPPAPADGPLPPVVLVKTPPPRAVSPIEPSQPPRPTAPEPAAESDEDVDLNPIIEG